MAKRIHSSWFFFRCGSNATSVLFFLVVPGFTGFLCEMLTILTVRRLVPRVFYFISTAFILVPIEQVHVSLASICPRPVIIGNVGTGGKGFLSLSLSLSLYAFTEFSTEFRTRGPAVLTRAVGFLVDAVSHWFLPGSVMCYWTWYRFIFCGLIFNFFCGGGGGWGGASLSPAISAVVSGNRWKGLAPRFFFHLFTEFFYRVLCEGERPRPPKGPADWLVNVPPNKPNGFSINATRFRFLLPRRPGRHLENKKIPCRLTSPRKPTVTLLAR